MENSRIPVPVSVPAPAHLPTEIWIEIFKNVDTTGLLNSACVCKRWNQLIFTHLSNRIQLNLDLDAKKYPNLDKAMVPERSYHHLSVKSFKLDCPKHLLNEVKRIAVNLRSLTLELVYLDGAVLAETLEQCKHLKSLSLKATYFECDATLFMNRGTHQALSQLSFNVTNYITTFNWFSFTTVLLSTMSKVQELNLTVNRPYDLNLLNHLAPQLKKLIVTVCCPNEKFLNIKLPELEHLELTLLQQEQLVRLEHFLKRCPVLKTASLFFRYGYGRELLRVISANLPMVEYLQLGGRHVVDTSLSGMERMTRLKHLSLHCSLFFREEHSIVPMPSVEKLSLCCCIRFQKMSDFLKRFPNLKHLTFQMDGDELQSISEIVPLLEDISVNTHRIRPEMITQMAQITNLKKLSIDANIIARVNFRALGQILALPAIKYLKVKTRSNIPPNVAALVAAENRACRLILNGKLVAPSTRNRRSGVKRKQLAVDVVPAAPNESAPSAAEGSGQQLASGSGLLAIGDGEANFAPLVCSSPKRMNTGDQNIPESHPVVDDSNGADSGVVVEPAGPDDNADVL